MKKTKLALITDVDLGLAHYAVSMYESLKKHLDPYYVTYTRGIPDDLVVEKVDHIYRLLNRHETKTVLETIKFFYDNGINTIIFNASADKKYALYFSAILSKAKLMGIKIIGILHDVLPFVDDQNNFLESELLYSNMDHFIVGSEKEKDRLKTYFKIHDNKIDIIVHPPYTIFNNNKYSYQTARDKLGIPKDKKVVLFFGHLKVHKGLQYLIEAFRYVIKENPDTLLYASTRYLATSSHYCQLLTDCIEELKHGAISKNVTLVTDYIKSTEVEPIFKAADLIVLPYTKVSQSGVLQLAWAFSKPVVITNVFSEKDLIDHRFGRVANHSDSLSLAESINQLVSMESINLKKMGEEAHKFISNKYSWDGAANLIKRVAIDAFNNNA